MSNASVITIEVPGLRREVNLHELPTKKGGTWFCLARMKDGAKVAVAKGAEFAAEDPNELPISYTINGVAYEAKLGETKGKNPKPKTYVSTLVDLDDGRKVRVLVQASSTSEGFWIYSMANLSSNGVAESDIL